MRRIPQKLLSIILCLSLIFSLSISTFAAETHDVFLDIDSTLGIAVYNISGEPIAINNSIASLEDGIYKYELNTGAAGYFCVDDKTTVIKFSKIDFYNVLPTADPSKAWYEYGSLTVTSKNGQLVYTAEIDSPSVYYVPQSSLEYYSVTFTPIDSNYLTTKWKVYANTDLQSFRMLNLSDAGRIHLIEKNIATVIAPKDMEVWLTWQLKFYTERNYELQQPDHIEGDYAYYTMHVPEESDNNMAAISFMLRQSGKITRYGWDSMVGTWDSEHDVFTINELYDSTIEIADAYEANMLTNLPLSSHINLSTDGFYDIAPLRAVQATNQSNRYNDPEWHYLTVGDSVEVLNTTGDEIWQYGLVKAKKQGTSLVLFWYDAMESPTVYKNNLQQYLWQGVWPELTGVAVVTVSDEATSTVISPNIDMTEGRVVYYLSSQTNELGETAQLNNHAEYSFTPTASNNGSPVAISKVRVHAPITVTNGVASCGDDWLSDSAWKEYESVNGSYTISLEKGRNIIEITAVDGTVAYHVITSLPVDVTISNATTPETELTDGTTAKIGIDGVLVPMYKLSAVYNPSRNALNFMVNGREVIIGMGQYLEQPLTFTYSLTEDDIGTVTFADCAVGTAYWGAELNAHRYLGHVISCHQGKGYIICEIVRVSNDLQPV